MNQPYVAPTYEQMLAMEHTVFDAMDSLCAALSYGLLLGWGMQAIKVKVGLEDQDVPGIVMTFPAAEGGDGSIRQAAFGVGRDAPSVPHLIALVGMHAHGIIMEAQSKGMKVDDYLARRGDNEKARQKNRPRILSPN